MRRRIWLGFALAAAIAVGSVALALVVHEREGDSFQRETESAAQRSASQVRASAALSISRLATAGSFFRVVDRLDLDDFGDVGGEMLRGSALDAAALVETQGRCCAVTSLPSEGAEARVDRIDVTADPRHRGALRRARDGGRPAATSLAPALVGPGAGILVYQPVYREDASLRTTAQRRASLIGFAVGVIRPAELAATAARALPDDAAVALRGRGGHLAAASGELSDPVLVTFTVADRTVTLAVAKSGGPGVGLPALIVVVGLSLAGLLTALVLVWSRHERMVELQREASHDPLTGLKNRRRFSEELHAELSRSHRHGSEGAVMMLDVDYFKRVNDTLGHPAGDRVIAEIASVLKTRMRETDVVARLGGDEFGVVLPHCDRAEARAVAESVATAVREHESREHDVPPVTVSIGIALYRPADTATRESLLGTADKALYEAKRNGRDSIRLAGETTPQPQHARD